MSVVPVLVGTLLCFPSPRSSSPAARDIGYRVSGKGMGMGMGMGATASASACIHDDAAWDVHTSPSALMPRNSEPSSFLLIYVHTW